MALKAVREKRKQATPEIPLDFCFLRNIIFYNQIYFNTVSGCTGRKIGIIIIIYHSSFVNSCRLYCKIERDAKIMFMPINFVMEMGSKIYCNYSSYCLDMWGSSEVYYSALPLDFHLIKISDHDIREISWIEEETLCNMQNLPDFTNIENSDHDVNKRDPLNRRRNIMSTKPPRLY